MCKARLFISFVSILSTVTCFSTTQELWWDNGVPHLMLTNYGRAVMFTMPFDGDVLTARIYVGIGYDDPFELLLTPVSGNMPDEGNAHGYLDYPGGEAIGEGWLDVDISSMRVHLPKYDYFFLVFWPYPGTGLPTVYAATGPEGINNRWSIDGTTWNYSSYGAYMFRVIVDDGVGVESASLGEIKAGFK